MSSFFFFDISLFSRLSGIFMADHLPYGWSLAIKM